VTFLSKEFAEACARADAAAPVAPAAPLAVVSTAVHDREWWAEEAVRAGTDRSSLVAAGMVEQPQPETITPWDAPSWREAAVAYHKDRNGRRLSVEIEPKRLARLRRLLLSEVSLERAWHELNRGDGRAPQATVEALVYGLRDGIDALPTKPERLRRLSESSADQLKEVCARLQNFKPTIARPWTADEVDALVSIWAKSHE
jgi:hypothetical protein